MKATQTGFVRAIAQPGSGLFIFAIALALVCAAAVSRVFPEARLTSVLLGGSIGFSFLLGAILSQKRGAVGPGRSAEDELAAAPVACALLDGERRVLWLNPVARRLLRIEGPAAVGRRWDEVLRGQVRSMPGKKTIAEGVRLGESAPDGSMPTLHYQVLPVSMVLENGAQSRFLLMMRDVSHLMTDLRDASECERLRAAACMATQIAHEVRNPVAAISGSAQLLGLLNDKARRGDKRSVELLVQEQDVLCRSIVEESQRLDQIIAHFLSFSDLSEESLRTVLEYPEHIDMEVNREEVAPV
ncbi:MAG TPA: histidine kinase dimerization/phospho-acceptor domain-containing protein [Kiritimatiellia bacterium]|nr:histidine kinase dimerization/phospho-acceptor domain-containing protein [Kiritimatiellia bacterium]